MKHLFAVLLFMFVAILSFAEENTKKPQPHHILYVFCDNNDTAPYVDMNRLLRPKDDVSVIPVKDSAEYLQQLQTPLAFKRVVLGVGAAAEALLKSAVGNADFKGLCLWEPVLPDSNDFFKRLKGCKMEILIICRRGYKGFDFKALGRLEEVCANVRYVEIPPMNDADARNEQFDLTHRFFKKNLSPAVLDLKGKVERVVYHSSVTDTERALYIYTPSPSLTFAGKDSYPVLYLLHGAGDDESGWVKKGSADKVFDRMFANREAIPMIVVMPDGRGDMREFSKIVTKDIIPFVEKHYPVIPAQDSRALAGLSRGGMQTMECGLYNTDKFAYLCVLSSGWLLDADAMRKHLNANAAVINKNLKFLWFMEGGQKDFAWRAGHLTLKLFRECGIDYRYSEVMGGHSWPVWHKDLANFLPYLFRD